MSILVASYSMTDSAGQRVARLQWDARRIEEIPIIHESREFALKRSDGLPKLQRLIDRVRVRIPKQGSVVDRGNCDIRERAVRVNRAELLPAPNST